MPPRFSVVLPCYNESETLPRLFSRFGEVLGERTDLEVIFVDNGSTDASPAVLAAELAKPKNHWARQVRVPINRGYGFGILAGLQVARGEYLGWTHADSQYDPKYVAEGFSRLVAAPDPAHTLVQGRRIGRGGLDIFFTGGMTLIACAALHVRVSDINAQPKLFPRALFDNLQNPPHDFSLDLYLLFVARTLGHTVVRLPVVFADRLYGDAKGGAGSLRLKWKLTKRTWKFIWNLRRETRTRRK